MGCDKAGLRHPDGRTLVDRTRDLLVSSNCGTVFLSLRSGQRPPSEESRDVAVIRDGGTGKGPMAGIVAAMAAAPDADWWVVACDLPKLDANTLGFLHERWRETENADWLAYRSETDGEPEPLCAIYRARSRPSLARACADGNHGLRAWMRSRPGKLFEPVTAGALRNANTPEEWRETTAL